jgi:hypothetical protein
MATVAVNTDFKWILLEILIQILIYIFANLSGGSMRGKAFTKQFMEANFESDFQAFGKSAPALGVPDCGTGRFSDKLPYDIWLAYNALQYTAGSALQSIIAQVLITLGLGLYMQSVGIIAGIVLIIWRLLYTFVGRAKPATLALLEPINHVVHFSGLVWVAYLAFVTARAV